MVGALAVVGRYALWMIVRRCSPPKLSRAVTVT